MIYAGINSYNRAKAWGEWLCLTHIVGTRFEILNQSRSTGHSYDLAVFGIQPEDAQRLADADSVVKVVNEDNMEMAFSVGALYLVEKAELESNDDLATVTEAFSISNGKNGKTNQQGLEIGTQVLIRSTRHQGKFLCRNKFLLGSSFLLRELLFFLLSFKNLKSINQRNNPHDW